MANCPGYMVRQGVCDLPMQNKISNTFSVCFEHKASWKVTDLALSGPEAEVPEQRPENLLAERCVFTFDSAYEVFVSLSFCRPDVQVQSATRVNKLPKGYLSVRRQI